MRPNPRHHCSSNDSRHNCHLDKAHHYKSLLTAHILVCGREPSRTTSDHRWNPHPQQIPPGRNNTTNCARFWGRLRHSPTSTPKIVAQLVRIIPLGGICCGLESHRWIGGGSARLRSLAVLGFDSGIRLRRTQNCGDRRRPAPLRRQRWDSIPHNWMRNPPRRSAKPCN